LLLIVAVVIGLGSNALWNGRPSNWPDLIATDEVVIAASRWAVALSAVFVVCAIAAFMNLTWAFIVTTIWLTIAVAILFWGHYVLFGKWDAVHMVTNVVVAVVILLLLWKGTENA